MDDHTCYIDHQFKFSSFWQKNFFWAENLDFGGSFGAKLFLFLGLLQNL